MVDLEVRLRDYGAELIANERPVEKAEVQRIARAEIESGPVTSLDVFDPSQAEQRRPVPWKVALVTAAAALLLFIPFLFDTSSDDPAVVTDPRPAVTTTFELPEEMKSEQFVRRSSYDIGVVDWYEAPLWLPGGSIAQIDGRFHTRDQSGVWYSSDNGYEWVRSPSSSPLTSQVIDALDAYAVFDSADTTWLMVREDGQMKLFRLVGDRWVEESLTIPPPPSGVSLASSVDLSTPSRIDRFLNTTVALLDETPVTVPYPGGGTAQMVTMGGSVYAYSLDGPSTDDLILWRLRHGRDWETIDKPSLPGGEVQWVALTARHDRLMLTVGTGSWYGAATQAVWTTTDGDQWDALDVGVGLDAPAPPQPTEFGWMLTTVGNNEGGLWEWAEFRAWLSSDGFTWERVSVPGGPNSNGGGPAIPLTYQAGLFMRPRVALSSFEIEATVVGRLEE